MTNAAKYYAAKYYAEINRDYKHTSFIANVIFTSSSKPTTRLRNLLEQLKSGREFSPLSFKMPYEGFFVDGIAVRPEFLLSKNAKPQDFRLVG